MRVTDTNDLFGRFFLKKSGTTGKDGYYTTLLALEPMLRSPEWMVTSGYYININIDPQNSVRLSYFIKPGNDVTRTVNNFASTNNFEHVKTPESVKPIKISREYGGEELRFRRFLSTYALIGLEIMAADLLHALRLFATFRFQVTLPRLPYRQHFEDTFSKQSPYYQSLPDDQKEQFWKDMSHWPDPQQVDWAHMFVNMVLGCDWSPICFLQRGKALSIPEINGILTRSDLGFEVPESWKP